MARYTLTLALTACVLVALVAAQSTTTTTSAPTTTTTTTSAPTTTTTTTSAPTTTTTTTSAPTTTTTTTTSAPTTTTTTTTAAPTTTTTTAAPTTTTTTSAPTTTTTATTTTTTAGPTTTTASGTTTTTTAGPTTTTASGTTTTTTAGPTTTTASGTTTTTTAGPTTTTTTAAATTTTTAAPTTIAPQSLVNIGRVTYFLGNDSVAGAANGAGTGPSGALLNRPLGCAFDNAGNFFFADTLNSVIRRVAAGSSSTTTFLGALNTTGDVQANGTSARFGSPYTFRFTPDFTTAFVTDFAKHKILKVTIATTEVTLFAGQASGLPGNTDATGSAAALNGPGDIVIRATSLDMYVTEVLGNRVRKVTSAAVTTLFAGNANGTSGYNDAVGGAALFNNPIGIVALESDGRLFVADSVNKVIRAIDAAATVSTVAGDQSANTGNGDGIGTSARFVEPWGLALDADAAFVFIADKGNNVIRRMTIATFQIVTVVGTLNPGWTSATVSTNAQIDSPNSLCFFNKGSQSRLYITGDHSISFVSLSRTVTVTATLPATPSPNGTTTGTGTTTRTTTGTGTTRVITPTTAANHTPTPAQNGTTATSGPVTTTTAPNSLSAAPARASLLVAAAIAALVAAAAF